jgi:hypothetical protein
LMFYNDAKKAGYQINTRKSPTAGSFKDTIATV